MTVDDVRAAMVSLFEEYEVSLASGFAGESLAIVPRKQAVSLPHDHHERLSDLLREALERHVPRASFGLGR